MQVFANLHLQEESFYRQKSRIRWLKNGDLNTKFFHHSVNRRHLHNRIISILDGEHTTSVPAEVQGILVDHFRNLLAASPPAVQPSMEEVRAVLNHTLDADQV